MAEAMRIPTITEPGFEADDMIGYLSVLAEKEGLRRLHDDPDKDYAQLVTEKVRMYRPGRQGNPAQVWGPAEVCERFGIEDPLQVIDLLGADGRLCGQHSWGAWHRPQDRGQVARKYGSMEILAGFHSRAQGQAEGKP